MKHAELERLRCAPRRDVLVPSRAHEPEPRAESLSKSFGVIAFHGQAATLFRTIWSECRDDRRYLRKLLVVGGATLRHRKGHNDALRPSGMLERKK
jgi:hypothetical protein